MVSSKPLKLPMVSPKYFEGFKPELLAVKVGWNFKKKIGVTKKRHAANFGIWSPKRLSTLANGVVLSWYSFRNPILIIVAVSFFCDAAYFRWRIKNFRLCWLWAAITPVQKLRTPISHTFLESSGRQLSHGATHIGSTTSECWVIVGNTKKYIFLRFWVSVRKKNSSGRRSDNIDASGLPNSSSESWRPEDSENVVVFEIWRFWTGVMVAQSQVIKKSVRKNWCFQA